MSSSTIVLVVAAVAVAAAVWKLVTGGIADARFVVDVRGPGVEGIRVKGQVPGHTADEVAEFVAGLELPTGARLWGMPDRERITLRFSSHVPEHLHQRLRNFFYLAR